MAKKPTYDELKKRNRDLKKEAGLLKKAEKGLRESMEKFRTIFDNANDVVVYTGVDGTILDLNNKVEDVFGYRKEEVVGKNFAEFGFLPPEDLEKMIKLFSNVTRSKVPKMQEINALRKDGSRVVIEVNNRMVVNDGELKGVINIIRDITDRKEAEEALREHRDHLDELVNQRTKSLEEANTALRVLLKQSEEVKNEMEEKILTNVKELVAPYIERIKKTRLDDRQKNFLEILESNLNDIISPFSQKLSSKYLNLTPTEMQVANLIRHGKTTKDIAGLLNLSITTINFHRANIRKKMGIKNIKANLRSYLLSLQK